MNLVKHEVNFLNFLLVLALDTFLKMTAPFCILLLWENKFHDCLKTNYVVYLFKNMLCILIDHHITCPLLVTDIINYTDRFSDL